MRIHVLLMEDNPSLAEQMGRALSAAGHDLRSVTGVGQALRELDRRLPHIVLSDFHVTDGTAADLLAGMKARGLERVPVIISTAAGSVARDVAARYPQVRDILDKPVDVDLLIAQAERFADQTLVEPTTKRLIGPDERHRILELAWADALPESPVLIRS